MNAANSVDSTTRTIYIRNRRTTPPAAATTPTTSLAKRKPHGRRCRDRLSESMLARFTPQDACRRPAKCRRSAWFDESDV